MKDFERIKVDMTDVETPEIEKLIEDFSILGVPSILFLDRSGQEVADARVTGFVDADEFLDNMSKYSIS